MFNVHTKIYMTTPFITHLVFFYQIPVTYQLKEKLIEMTNNLLIGHSTYLRIINPYN